MNHGLASTVVALALTTAPAAALAVPPTVTAVFPSPQRIDAWANTSISVTFDQRIDPTTVVPARFRVFGRWSGPATGTLQAMQKQIIFTPDEPFFAGEWVTVNLSKGIESLDHEPLATGYAWNFWIAAGSGTLNLTYSGRVTCRQGLESWVQVYGAYAGDLDNDGWSDLAAPCEQTHDVRIFMNNGAGSYTTFTPVAIPSASTPSPNEGADFNNDGEIDLVIGSTTSDKVSILFGDGTGAFPSGTAYTAGTAVRGVGVLDLNGDGWDDIVTANRVADNMSVFMNNGNGTFASAVTTESGSSGEYSIGVADANNDGLLDVIVACYNSPYNVTVMLSDGTGDLLPQTPRSGGGVPWQMAVGDYNGDGNVDVAVCNSTANRMGVLMGDGAGGLAAVQTYLTGGFPLAIDAGDIDGDGDLELVTSNYSSATWTVYENTGGTFANPVTLNASTAGSCAVLHDRDNDGDLDLTGLDEQDDWIYLYTNPALPTGVASAPRPALSVENHPNPFNPSTTIHFRLGSDADVVLAVFDASGAFVATLAAGRYGAGPHDVHWDGADSRGHRVSSGVYFARLTSGGVVATRKMMLLK